MTGSIIPQQPSIKDLTRDELKRYFAGIGEPAFRADQVFLWLFNKRAGSFEVMTNIRRDLRSKLAADFRLNDPVVGEILESEDGTRKFSLVLHDKMKVESVIIPDNNRVTLCVSTQVGCKRGCRLCATARMGFKRNLSSGEMLDQIIAANNSLPQGKKITHLVFMGMGEPLDNLDELLKALAVIHADHGICISPKRTTISTVGVLESIRRLGDEGFGEGLAVSLHAGNDETRRKLIPLAGKVALNELLDAAKQYARKREDKITFEYVMIKGVNCSAADGKQLAKILSQLPSKINLIPYNTAAGGEFESPSEAEMEAFKQPLMDSPVIVTLRKSRGRDIRAACGQLCV